MFKQSLLAALRLAKTGNKGLGRLQRSFIEVASTTGNAHGSASKLELFPSHSGAGLKTQPCAYFARGKRVSESIEENHEQHSDEVDLSKCEGLMQSSLDYLQKALKGMRTGRASAGMLDIVTIEAYNDKMPLKSVASVSVRDSKALAVSVYDENIIKAVEKGIRLSSLGLNPVIEGGEVIVNVPRLTKESVIAMQKLVKKEGESAKTSIRNSRKEILGALKKLSSEDDRKRLEKQVQALTDKHVKEVDQIVSNKDAELSSAL